jgi:hypothetical protein
MFERNFILYLMLLITSFSMAQDKFTISGYIEDLASGEELIASTVYVQEIKSGTVTNVYGFYSITLPKGTYNIKYSYIGYKSVLKQINLDDNIKIDIELQEDKEILQEVIVSGKKQNENVQSIEMSVAKMDIGTIKKMPALLGEVDVIKSIQTLPGVSTVGEGASGFNVRGGGVDQNLVLLDEAPVYNSSHLLGFFSVFNPDAVKDVKLIKGGIPAQFGGRLSSLLDIRMKEGNLKRFEGTGGIGTIFSRLSLEGPIQKNKGSIIVAGRRSYIDVLAKPFLPDGFEDIKFYFYDLTIKGNYKINDRNRLFLSHYTGRDVIDIGFGFDWGNNTNTLRYNRVFGEKLFSNFTLVHSDYNYKIRFGSGDNAFDWSSRILNLSPKAEMTWYANPSNTLTFGAQLIGFMFEPGNAVSTNNGVEQNISLDKKYSTEGSIYLGNEQKVNEILSLQYGLRYSLYSYGFLDSITTYTFTETTPGVRRQLAGVQGYGQFEHAQLYHNLEPRLSIKYSTDESSSIKASYNRMTQYVHLVSNTTASTPLDLWTPSSNNIKPQIADQVALGYFRNFKDNLYETSVELYFKDMQNQIDYVSGANLLLNPFLEADLLSGRGRAYGAEFYLKKAKGKFNGWISYTLSRSERKVEGINNNEWYASRFDKMHNFNTTLIYDLNKKWSFSSNLVYASGTPATFPTTKYEVQGIVIQHNPLDLRNGERISDYHRLDFATTRYFSGFNILGRKFDHHIVLAVYNVYRRRNAFSIFFQESSTLPGNFEAVRYSIIGDIVPSITYNFNF